MDEDNNPPTPPQAITNSGDMPDDLEPISPDMPDSDVQLNNDNDNTNEALQNSESVNKDDHEDDDVPIKSTAQTSDSAMDFEESESVPASDSAEQISENVADSEDLPAKDNSEEADKDNIEESEKTSSKNADEPMETDETDKHPTEEIDMENVEEAEKDKSIAEDPFDALFKNTTPSNIAPPSESDKTGDKNDKDGKEVTSAEGGDDNNDEEGDDDVNRDNNDDGDGDVDTSAAVDDDGDAEGDARTADEEGDARTADEEGDARTADEEEDVDSSRVVEDEGEVDANRTADDEDDDADVSRTADATSAVDDSAVDDIEEGQGVDEEISLLPDAEREISEADKQRAIEAEQAASKAQEGETVVEEDDDDVIDTTGNKDTTESDQPDDGTNENHQISTDDNDESQLSATPKENEIKEIQDTDLHEHDCINCNTLRSCKYTLLQDGIQKYLCEIACVKLFQKADATKSFSLIVRKIPIIQIPDAQQECIKCNLSKLCKFRLHNIDNEWTYLCDTKCLDDFIGLNIEKYVVTKKRYLIEEISETSDPNKCMQCSESVKCQFLFKLDDEDIYVCNDACLNLLMSEQPDRFRVKRRQVRVRDLPRRGGGSATTVTENDAESEAPAKIVARTEEEMEAARLDRETSFIRRCVQCFNVVEPVRTLQWETMDFCSELCLGQYQSVIGASCTTCHNAVTTISLGKYCVRFGYEIRQFCRAGCLDEYKKGLKVCSFCQKDISKDQGFLASVSGQFKDFCTQHCMKRYDEMCNPKKKTQAGICSVCNNVDQIRVEIIIDGRDHSFCSNPCFSAFEFVNNIFSDKCSMCEKFFERKSCDPHTIYFDQSTPTLFCSKICTNIYIILNRKIVNCQWCKVKKYNFDMIQKQAGTSQISFCSLNCLTLSEGSSKKQKCDQCGSFNTPQYHLTMSDASLRNFCTYQCVMSFQSQFSHTPLSFDGGDVQSVVNEPVPTGLPKRIKGITSIKPMITTKKATLTKITKQQQQSLTKAQMSKSKSTSNTSSKSTSNNSSNQVPIITKVTSLASSVSAGARRGRTGNNVSFSNSQISMSLQPVVELEQLSSRLLKKTYSPAPSRRSTRPIASPPPPRPPTPPPPREPEIIVQKKTHVITMPPVSVPMVNQGTSCEPIMISKETTCKPTLCTLSCQTDGKLERRIYLPIPIPIYVPQAMQMFSTPIPTPFPIPLPIPIPIFVPTNRNSSNGIMKEIKKIQEKMPTDPFEAELLMMAEMVAGDKKKGDSDSGTEDEDDVYGTETITENNTFGEDMLQMALKMAGEYEEPAVDLESAMQASTITPSSHPHLAGNEIDENNPMHHHLLMLEHQRQMQPGQRGRKRQQQPAIPRARPPTTPPNKRQRRQEMPVMQSEPEPIREPIEKADANMCLKFTFGVNAWKQWVMTKNSDLEKSSVRRKPFKSELLQLTADELNYSLCLFVKEVRKPNGSEYAPDTIYYLVLGIQQYLYENGRIDNIFTDPYYEKFTDCLDDVAKKFSVLYNDSQYIVTRVEEEHLWECKQLGAHSPHVLLSTLMFFNTKHFNLTTVEEHMQLSFSHIMKHWKRNPNQVSAAAKTPGSRNVLLRFYPPQSALDNNSRKKKVYEQQENEENPLRCPVKLYEFYLSKCPESVKTRNDVFYLQPERSCVPDSPVWYSTQALEKDSLSKMLHRVKMVKEINIALLTS